MSSKNIISALENFERAKIRNTSIGSNQIENELSVDKSNVADFTNELLKGNKQQLELEVLLRESINVIYESEKHLQVEIERKDEFLEMFENLCELHKENDLKFKGLLNMYEKNISTASKSDSGDDKFQTVHEENVSEVLKKSSSCETSPRMLRS